MKLSIQTKELPFSTVLYLLDHAIAWFVINAPGVEAKDDMFNKFVEQLKEPGVGMMMIAESYDGLEGSRLMFYTNKNVLYAVMLPGSDLRWKDIEKEASVTEFFLLSFCYGVFSCILLYSKDSLKF